MNVNNTLLDSNLTTTVKYNGKDYRIQKDKKGFRYIKVTENGKRVIVPIKEEHELDEITAYVINGVFRTNPDERLDKLVKERIGYKKVVEKKEPLINVFVKCKDGRSLKLELPRKIDIKDYLNSNKIDYHFFKYQN